MPQCMRIYFNNLRAETPFVKIPQEGSEGRYKLGLRVLSWNANGMSNDGVQDMLTMLTSRGDWDVVLLQEGPKSDDESLEELEGGHLFFKAPAKGHFRSVGILIHRRWAAENKSNIERSAVTGRIAYVDMNVDKVAVRLISGTSTAWREIRF